MMTMDASSNSRDGLSSTSLQLSVEQWELLRRLRNSHLTKQQIIRAYDELDRLDRELGNLFNTAPLSSSSTTVPPPPPDPASPSTMITQQISPSSSSILNNNNKRPHSQTVNGLTSRSSSTTSNGYHSHLHHHTTSPNLNIRSRNGGNEIQSETINQNDIEEETRELQELLSYVFIEYFNYLFNFYKKKFYSHF
jgi:hypothetical protein